MAARCARLGCPAPALAQWWLLCADCTLPLLEQAGPIGVDLLDQHQAAGWEALAWAERIAPSCWGNASDDPWVTAQRCLIVAACICKRSVGCAHSARDVPQPVVVVARAPRVLRCPPCAESVASATSTAGHACDRCVGAAVSWQDRVALVTGASLILVAQLCAPCRGAAHALG